MNLFPSNRKIDLRKNDSRFYIFDTLIFGKKKERVGTGEYGKKLLQNFISKFYEIFHKGGIDVIVNEIITKVSSDKDLEFEDILDEEKNIYNQDKRKIVENYQFQLKAINKTLFDEIDINKDGIIDSDEINIFFTKLKESRNAISDEPLHENSDTTNDNLTVANSESNLINPNSEILRELTKLHTVKAISKQDLLKGIKSIIDKYDNKLL